MLLLKLRIELLFFRGPLGGSAGLVVDFTILVFFYEDRRDWLGLGGKPSLADDF